MSSIPPKTAALIERGLQLVQAARYLEAARAFERAAQQSPTLAEAHAMRADALMRAGNHEAALASAERAMRLRPGWPDVLVLRGNIEAFLGRYQDAERSFRQALVKVGPTAALYANLGHALRQQERWSEALEAYEKGLSAEPNSAHLLASKGDVLLALGRPEQAEPALVRALELDGDSDNAERSLAAALLRLHKFEQVEAVCARILARDPASSDGLGHLIEALFAQGRLPDAEAAIHNAIKRAPDDIRLRIKQANWLWRSGRREDAIEAYRSAAHLGSGKEDRRFSEASLDLAPALLSIGRWDEGWNEYHWRYDRKKLQERYPELAAEPRSVRSAKESLRIRLRTDQGVGDELFFLRFAPLLRKRGHRLTLLTGSKLAALLAPMADVFDAIEDVDAVGKPTPCDVELLCSDLPLATDVLPPPSLEFQPEEARVSRLAKRLETFGGPPYIGVTWRGGVLPDEQLQAKLHWVYSKQVPLAELANVLRPLKATIVVLQRRVTNDELQTFGTFLGREAADLSAVHDDLRDSLALLSLLDEYIGVSNTNMHLLAGLQDKRGRVLVQTPAEWRWGVDGDTSVWFPGFRLYRQTPDKKWNAALRSLAEELRPYGASEPGLGIRRA